MVRSSSFVVCDDLSAHPLTHFGYALLGYAFDFLTSLRCQTLFQRTTTGALKSSLYVVFLFLHWAPWKIFARVNSEKASQIRRALSGRLSGVCSKTLHPLAKSSKRPYANVCIACKVNVSTFSRYVSRLWYDSSSIAGSSTGRTTRTRVT